MAVRIKRECPKCHADRTMMDPTFGVPGQADSHLHKTSGVSINAHCALPIRLVICPRCHLLEMYHDVGLEDLV